MTSINIGPLALSIGPILLLGTVFSSTITAWWIGQNRKDVDSLLWWVFLGGLLAARATFVILYFELYMLTPWKVIDIRDGGFSPLIGAVVAVAVTAVLAWKRRDIRKSLLLSVTAGMLFWSGGIVATSALNDKSLQVPNVMLTALDGSHVQLDSLAGKPIVINLWATWCPPCRREMPVLRDAQSKYPNVTFVFVNQGESVRAIQHYLKQEQLKLNNVFLDPRLELGGLTESRALPTTLFFDDSGALVERRAGELSAATLAQGIEKLLPNL